MASIKGFLSGYLAKRKEQKYVNQLKLAVSKSNLYAQHDEDKVSFSHIGLLGDIVYSVPAMLALANGKNIELYLDITQKSLYPRSYKHYNESKILTEKSVAFIKPLLLSNKAVKICTKLEDQKIDYDLNEFRNYPFDYRMGHICRWYFLTFGVSYDLTKPWLFAKPNAHYKDEIVIARSFRYRAPEISYRFLCNYKNLSFIGLDDEYEEMKQEIPSLKRIIVSNAFEMAEAIAGCKFFIGNQSFPFSVAEAIKAKRVLEVCPQCPNVIVDGPDGYDFCYQPQFEKIIKHLVEN
jgi:hypothetical protein